MKAMQIKIAVAVILFAILMTPVFMLNLDMLLQIFNYGVSARGTRLYVSSYDGRNLSADDIGVIQNAVHNLARDTTVINGGTTGIRNIVCRAEIGGQSVVLTIRDSTDLKYFQDGMKSESNITVPDGMGKISGGDIWINRIIKKESEKGQPGKRLDLPNLFDTYKVTEYSLASGSDTPVIISLNDDQKIEYKLRIYNIDKSTPAYEYTPSRFANFAYMNPGDFSELASAAGLESGYSQAEVDLSFEKFADLTKITKYLYNDLWYSVGFAESKYDSYFILGKILYIIVNGAWLAIAVRLSVGKFVRAENMRIYGTKHIPSAR